jgi:3-oxoacyl-[acyl-carrier protein] reductase
MSQGEAIFDFGGSKVLVTGGSNGIGYAIAQRYQAAGAQVTITGTQVGAADYDNDLSGLIYRQLRVQDRQQIEALAAGLDGLDILINNAGASMPDGMDEWSADGFEEAVRVNLFSAFHMASACQPLLAASAQAGGASVIGIASLTSFFGNDIVPGYGAAKAGLAQLAKSQCMKWAPDGIRSNAVAAGMTETRMTSIMKDIPEMNEPIIARTPMKRWGTPDEIASCVLFLSSTAASFINGQTVLVDGGYSIAG